MISDGKEKPILNFQTLDVHWQEKIEEIKRLVRKICTRVFTVQCITIDARQFFMHIHVDKSGYYM